QVIKDAPSTGANLVEDMQMGIEMAIQGHAPRLCPEASVTSVLPDRDKAAMGQRRRWEHGSLSTMFSQGPRPIPLALSRARIDLFALGLDLFVPPLALLTMLIVAHAIASGAALVLGVSLVPILISWTALALTGAAVFAAWFKYARRDLPFRHLLGVP